MFIIADMTSGKQVTFIKMAMDLMDLAKILITCTCMSSLLVSFGYVISLFQANIRLVLSVQSLCRHLHTGLCQCNRQEEKAGLDKGRLSSSYQPCYNRAIKQREQLPSCKHPSQWKYNRNCALFGVMYLSPPHYLLLNFPPPFCYFPWQFPSHLQPFFKKDCLKFLGHSSDHNLLNVSYNTDLGVEIQILNW